MQKKVKASLLLESLLSLVLATSLLVLSGSCFQQWQKSKQQRIENLGLQQVQAMALRGILNQNWPPKRTVSWQSDRYLVTQKGRQLQVKNQRSGKTIETSW